MQIPADIKKKPNYKPYTNPEEHKGKNYLPEPEGLEGSYIISVKSDSPFDNVSVSHFAFHKVIKSRPNDKGIQKDLAAVFNFTPNQLEVLKLKAEKKEMRRMDGNREKIAILDMLEIEELPPGGEYDDLMDLQGLRAAMVKAAKERPMTAEEIDQEMERLRLLKAEQVVDEIEDKGKAKEQEKEKALDAAQADEDEEKAKKKKPKRRR